MKKLKTDPKEKTSAPKKATKAKAVVAEQETEVEETETETEVEETETPVHPVETEITKALGLELEEGENARKFRKRLIRAANRMEDAEWGKLSEEAQTWINAGVEAVRTGQPVPDFGDSVSGKPAPKIKAKKGACTHYRSLIIDHPDWKKDQLVAEMIRLGFSLAKSTAQVMFYETRATLEVLAQKGLLRAGKKAAAG